MNDETREYEPAPSLPVTETVLPEGLRFTDIETSLEGRVDEEKAMTRFLPQGFSTPTWIHLRDGNDNEYTLVVHPLTGRTEIRDGRVEMQREGL
jgi:hypothetical protein